MQTGLNASRVMRSSKFGNCTRRSTRQKHAEYISDSGASLHMMGRLSPTPDDMKTVKSASNRCVVMTTSRTVEANQDRQSVSRTWTSLRASVWKRFCETMVKRQESNRYCPTAESYSNVDRQIMSRSLP